MSIRSGPGSRRSVDDESRDIRAVAGTNVKVEVIRRRAARRARADRRRHDRRAACSRAARSIGAIAVTKPGRYQIGARVANEFVALSDEYTIEVVPDEKPTIEIRKPGRDWRATSIEEVPVRIRAEDDFRLRDVSLRYSVNGGEWQAVPVGGGAKSSESESLLRPGGAGRRAGEGSAEAARAGRSGLVLRGGEGSQGDGADRSVHGAGAAVRAALQQAQGGGSGGGGMGDEQGAISERQREILLATWNLQRNDERNARSQQQLEDSAKMLAELQATLAQQARTLAERTRARASLDEDERIRTFVESLERAATVMDPAIAST